MGTDDGSWFEKMTAWHARRMKTVQLRLAEGEARYRADVAAYGNLTRNQKIRAAVLGSLPLLVLGIAHPTLAGLTAAIIGSVLSAWYTTHTTRDWKFGPKPDPASYIAPGGRALLKGFGRANAWLWLAFVYCMNAIVVLWIALRISHAMG